MNLAPDVRSDEQSKISDNLDNDFEPLMPPREKDASEICRLATVGLKAV